MTFQLLPIIDATGRGSSAGNDLFPGFIYLFSSIIIFLASTDTFIFLLFAGNRNPDPDSLARIENQLQSVINIARVNQTMLLELKSKVSVNQECCWFNMIQTSRSKSNNLRAEFLRKLGISERCFVTKKCGMPNHIISICFQIHVLTGVLPS